MNIGSLWATIGLNVSNISAAEKAFSDFERTANTSLDRMQVRLDKLGNSLKTFGTIATVGLTLPIAAIGVASTKTFATYETSMAHIVGLTGTTAEQTKQWSEELLKMGPAVAQGPNKLADALYFIASSGVDSSLAMDILEKSAKGASAGLGEVKDIADLATSAINAYGSSNLDVTKILDQLIVAVKYGKAEAAELGKVIGFDIPVAAQLGVTFDQVVASLAGMTQVGSDASTAAFQLRQVLSHLLGPSKEADKALAAMGTSADSLRKSLREKGLLETLAQLKTLTDKYGESMIHHVFPEVRSLTGVLQLVGKNVDQTRFIFQQTAAAQNELEKAFGIASETLKFKYDVAVATVQVSLIKLGEVLKGPLVIALQSIASYIQSITDWFTQLSAGTQQFIIKIGFLLAALGPAALILSGVIKIFDLITLGIIRMINIIPGLIAGFRLLSVAIATNPWLQLALIVGVYVGALIALKKTTVDTESVSTEYNQALSKQYEALKKINGEIEVQVGNLKNLNIQEATNLATTIQKQINLEQEFTRKLEKEIAKRQKDAQEEIRAINPPDQPYVSADSTQAQINKIGQGIDQTIKKLQKSGNLPLLDNEQLIESQKHTELLNEDLKKVQDHIKQLNYSLSDTKVIDDLNASVKKEEDTINRIAKVRGGSYDAASAKVSLYSSALEKLASVSTSTDKQLESMNEKLKAALTDQALNKYNKEIDVINQKAAILGYTTDIVKEKFNLTKQTLKDLSEQDIKTGSDVDYLSETLSNLKKIVDAGTFPIEKMSTSLDGLAQAGVKAGEYLVKPLSGISKKLSELAMNNSLDSILGGITDVKQLNRISDLSSHLADLEKQFTDVYMAGEKLDSIKMTNLTKEISETSKQLKWLQLGFSGQFKVISDGIVNLVNSVSGYINQQKSNELDYIQSVAQKENKSQEWVAAQQDSINKKYGKKLKGYATAAAIINIAQGITKAFADYPFPVALILSGLIAAAGGLQIATIQAQKFAKGGIVPPGYSNDTYPALLSSGEHVVPAEKLPAYNNMQPASIIITIDGTWEIQGDKLVYLYDKTKRKYSYSF